jgi:hypothetical protein
MYTFARQECSGGSLSHHTNAVSNCTERYQQQTTK